MNLTDLQKKILKQKGFKVPLTPEGGITQNTDNGKDEEILEIEKFLNPKWERDLFDYRKIKDIDKSIERIKKAINKNEKIVVYADYDCDGIPGAVILNDFFEKIGQKNFSVYIPHRHNEGYGINKTAIEKFIKEKVNLIITVDLGITNLEEIKFAEENNINVIITDHHLPILNKKGDQILPECFSIINTKQYDDKYKEKFLCGSSTAWKLVHAFLEKYRKEFNIGEGWEKWLLDMVGIATIADLVPLKNENRLFAKYGLEVLKKSKRPGLRKIFKNAKINQTKINEDDIAFGIAPRINSASRMAEPIHAFYSLLHNEESLDFANELENYNNTRKRETKDANDSIDYESFKNKKIILTGNENWTPGIIGLVASKISERVGKTTFVWGVGEEKNILKGSVRSLNDGYNVVEIMTGAKEILENFGGHEMAGGFSLDKNKLKEFEIFLEEYSNNNFLKNKIDEKDDEEIKNFIDTELEKINKNIFREINIFSPFGVENEKPIFRIKIHKDDFVSVKRFGKNSEHLEVKINNVRGVEFFVNKEREEELKNKKEFFINIEWDNFKGDVMIKFVK